MEVTKVIDYEFLFPLELKHPKTEEPTGIKMKIRSASSSETQKVTTEHVGKTYERLVRGKLVTGEMRVKESLEQAASYIAEWDWGDNTLDEERNPPLTKANAIKALKVPWIFQQVTEAANNTENFSGT